ncbi:MAG: sigma-70 family RNA polymerase sigma factor [Longimicrobiales bacterium]
MNVPTYENIDSLLARLRTGDEEAFDQLFPLVYDQLHQAAKRQRRRWQSDDTLNTTALVHEAYLRLAGQSAPGWQGEPHFLAVAARAMRQIMIDHARGKRRAKRGGQWQRVPLHEIEAALTTGGAASTASADALLALDGALRRLDVANPRQSRIVECRFFGGMAIADTAEALGVSAATVKRGWAVAQAWLYRELARELDERE